MQILATTTTTQDLSAAQRRELLAELLRKKARRQSTSSPLSYGQRALWFVYLLDRESAAYNIMYAARVRRDFDRQAFVRAFQAMINRHAALRTTYGMQDGVPIQTIHGYEEFQLQTVDARAWSPESLDAQIQRSADEPFDLEEGPVIRVQLFERDEERHVLLFTAHHIALDFWSFDVLFDELEALYRQEVTGVEAKLPPLAVQYSDFVRWQEEMLASEQGERMGEYWQKALEGNLPDLDLPSDRPRPPFQSFRGRSYHFRLPDELSEQLVALAKKEGATLYATLLAAFQVLLYRYSGQRDILVGSPTAGRNHAELDHVLGYFLNPVVLRGQLSAEQTFVEFLAKTRQTLVDGLSNQDFPFPLVVERLQPPRDTSRSPIFQVAFGWDKPRKLQQAGGDHREKTALKDELPTAMLDLEPFALGQQGAAFDLMLMMLHIGGSVSAALQYNSDMFDETTVARMVEHFQILLVSLVEDPTQKLGEVSLLTPAAEEQLLQKFCGPADDYPRDVCLHDLFEQQAGRTPSRVAVQCDDRTLTYHALNARANQLARHLQSLGVGPEDCVGICVERSEQMLIAILAVFKAAGCYVPLAPGTPPERRTTMLEECSAPVVLTQQALVAEFAAYDGRTVCLDDDGETMSRYATANLGIPTDPANLAYTIFTSGSTGTPKGVQIEHRAVVNFLLSVGRKPGIQADDVLLAVTTLTFDISVLELLLPVMVGAKVVILSREQAADGMQLADAVTRLRPTIMQATPATWRLLIEAGWQGDDQLKILCGGEALPRDLANLLLPRCGSLWNMYGPTETTIWSAVDRVVSADGPVPIGHPIANTQIYILDERLRPVPAGVTGDLYIGGDGLARGYLRRPELTAERFVADPFAVGAARLYKTGDLARHRADGNIEFLGRSDFQVKVRGFRIELGEIETHLADHPAIRQAVVTACQTGSTSDAKQLIAYVVAMEADQKPNVNELRDYLRQTLPDYMLPASFTWLDGLPLNPAGKVDRQALPEPTTSRPDVRARYAPPRNASEQALASIWARVLELDRVGIHDNFFDLGGASIQSLECAAHAEKAGFPMTPAMLFKHPTIAELADTLGPPAVRRAESVTVGINGVNVLGDPATETLAERARPAVADQPQTAAQAKTKKINTVIESLGVYLPPKAVSSKEILKGCKKRMWFPLEKMTGIKSRRMAGETEFAIDLAEKAITKCLESSRYDFDDIDLLIACNIVRTDTFRTISVEPNTTLKLKKRFGFRNAIAFDITNACTGMFTAMQIAQAYITTGTAHRAMIVSGEFITDITRTAQEEICEFMDPRLACLTVGDAGAAIVLEAAANNEVGFHELEVYSLSKYSRMCIGRLTDQPHGGPIMHVPDPLEHTAVAVKHSVMHAQYLLEKSPWSPEMIHQLIMHQTSDRSIREGKRSINKAFKRKICHDGNTINNIAHRGNTASTSHMVAVWDNIHNGRIRSGDNVVFGITGSGQTIGTGIYTFDDLPDRLRGQPAKPREDRQATVPSPPPLPPATGQVRVHSSGTAAADEGIEAATLPLTTAAGERCLAASNYDRSDIELLLFTGVTRTGLICEPAIATLIASELGINEIIESEYDKKTFAFDVYNGALGLLNGCQVAAQMIQSGLYRTAMVVAAEIEQNKTNFPEDPLGFREAASALILDRSPGQGGGFGNFEFGYFTQFQDARVGLGVYRDGKPFYDLREDDAIEDHYLACIRPTVGKLLDREGLDISEIRRVFPPQFSADFNRRLATVLEIDPDVVVDIARDKQDLFTSSLPFSFEHAQQQGLAQPGDIGLIVNVASGLQVGTAIYYF